MALFLFLTPSRPRKPIHRRMLRLRILASRLLVQAAMALLLATTVTGEDRVVDLGEYAVPVADARAFLEAWLRQEGFSVTREAAGGGMAGLSAARNGETFSLAIGSRSPLASAVTVSHGAGPATVEAMKRALADQAQPKKGEGEIPAGVLPHENAVICFVTAGSEPRQFSGFVIDGSGLVVTIAHDLDNGETVIGNDGKGETRGAIVKRDAARDLSLVRIERPVRETVSLCAAKSEIIQGERIYAIGCPQNRGRRILSGTVQRPPALSGGQPLWQVEMDVQPGSSGSPAFDAEGRLVGVVKGRLRGTHNRAFLIPLDTLRDFLEEAGR